ncbi:hypothetical protein [Streptomyces rubiginosohelvolus]|uniref:hypothetical protein n=1 Tax=Streptomyces rubiginosohelvolus TaxID=67362 RepID=UPI0035DA4F52
MASTNTLNTYFVLTGLARHRQNPEKLVTTVFSMKADANSEKRDRQRRNLDAECARHPHRTWVEVNAATEVAARLLVRPNPSY